MRKISLLALLLFVCTFVAQAAEQITHTESGTTLKYEVKSNNTGTGTASDPITVRVIKTTTSLTGYVVIPATFQENSKHYKVVEIYDEAFVKSKSGSGTSTTYQGQAITGITIPNTVTTLGSQAFRGCKQLTSVDIPSSITNPGSVGGNYGQFQECTALKTVTIHNKAVSGSMFKGCTSLTTVTMDGVERIGSNAFEGCTNLTSITLPQSVATVEMYVFKNCTKLSSVTIQNENAIVKGGVFQGCTSLDPNSIQYGNSPSSYLTLYTGSWNFIAGTGQDFSILSSNTPMSVRQNGNEVANTDNKHCDVAAIGFGYDGDYANKWNTDNYLYASNTMTIGEGYLVYLWNYTYDDQNTRITNTLTPAKVDMTGKYLTNNVTLQSHSNTGNASGSSTSAKWFAYGNPFDTALQVSNILSGLTNAKSNVLYVWENQNSQGENQLPNGKWVSDRQKVWRGEGFMVAATNGQNTVSGTLTYPTNSKSASEMNYGIKFTCTANDISSRIYAKQVANGSDGFDNNDAYALFGTGEDLVEPYFVVDGVELFHNRFASNNYTCDINFHAQKDGVATLSVSDVPEGTTVSIINLATDEETVLEEGENFEINVEQGENAGKYKIKITKGALSIADVENISDVNVWNNKGNIHVSGKDLKSVEVLNTLGQSIYMQQVGGNEYNFNLDREGSYIVRVKSQSGVKSQKIIVTK